jgi:hypothetical protein
MTEHAPDRIWSGIDIAKTIAGVLAAVSAAVVGSYLGVAGTLAGAAVASLIGSVGTEVYQRLFHRGRNTLRSTFTTAPAAVGTPPVEAAADEVPSADEPTPPPRQKLRWGRIAMVASALFVLAMGTLTLAEAISGRSVADATQGGTGDRFTVSTFFEDRSKGNPAPQSSQSPEPDQGGDQSPAGEPTGVPATAPTDAQPTDPQQPGPEPTGQPTDQPTGPQPPGPEPTGAPATGQQPAGGAEPNTGLHPLSGDTRNPDNGTE